MPTFLAEISHHHNSDKPDCRELLDIPEGADPEVHVVLLAISDEFGLDADQDAGKVAEALAQAKETGKPVKFELVIDEEPSWFTIWHQAGNFGLGEGDAKDKYENVWFQVQPYEPDSAMRERLQKLNKEELLEILLRTHATKPLDFPPDSR